MTSDELKKSYISALCAAFAPTGLAPIAKSIFAETSDKVIWRGIYISFHRKWGYLKPSPNIAVFCPAAEKLAFNRLSQIYTNQQRSPFFGKLGLPLLTHPLYDVVYRDHGLNRLPYSYDVTLPDEINTKAELIRNDFLLARNTLLDSNPSLLQLKERLLNDWAPPARMYAIAVGCLIDPNIGADEIDELLGSNPNPMCKTFAEHLKANPEGKAKRLNRNVSLD